SICHILDAEPKTELWYIAHAEPGSVIYYGLKNGIDKDEFRKSINEENLHDKIKSFSVKCGDFIFLPSGCLHAIGEGIVIFEIQQNSDTTYRVYDWGRMGIDGKPRTLHKDEALMCIDFEDNEPLMGNYNSGSLVRCPYFNVDILSARSGDKKKLEKGSRFSIYCLVHGSLGIYDQKIKAGDSFILPASERNVPIDFTANSESKIIRITMPDQ
ncbi:MAG: mannose-6-phosphate isomerase, partial [Alphaproteobacteria bacterium]|nr:mannose-6-phosphate isomerase [Alphaproteobacteria bacterium]